MTIGRYASLEEDYINGLLGLLEDRGTHPQIGQSVPFSVLLGKAKRSNDTFKCWQPVGHISERETGFVSWNAYGHQIVSEQGSLKFVDVRLVAAQDVKLIELDDHAILRNCDFLIPIMKSTDGVGCIAVEYHENENNGINQRGPLMMHYVGSVRCLRLVPGRPVPGR